MDSDFTPKKPKKFNCSLCDFHTCNIKDYKKHLLTDKHLKKGNDSKMVVNDSDFTPKNPKSFVCSCGKIYKYDSGYYRHKKKCYNNNNITENNTYTNENKQKDELINYLIKENHEFKNLILEIVKKDTTTNNHNINTNTNSHNKTFNLNLFLNETCKDAMNIQDFVNSITLQLSDLEKMGELGYVEGISNIITNNLKALDVTQRPIHCTDKKRETLYVKDEDKWEKENIEKKKIRKAIKHIAHKNSKLIPEFKDKYPDCIKSDSKKSDQYNHLIIEAMGGQGNNDVEKENQIIKNIAKEITIDKYVE
jgi:hypothetical protein